MSCSHGSYWMVNARGQRRFLVSMRVVTPYIETPIQRQYQTFALIRSNNPPHLAVASNCCIPLLNLAIPTPLLCRLYSKDPAVSTHVTTKTLIGEPTEVSIGTNMPASFECASTRGPTDLSTQRILRFSFLLSEPTVAHG